MADQRYKRILLLSLGLSLGAMLLLASGLQTLRLEPGKPLYLLDWLLARLASENSPGLLAPLGERTGSDPLTDAGDTVLQSFIVFFWLMLIFSIGYAIISPKGRKELIRLFILVLVLVYVLPLIAYNISQRSNIFGGREAAPGDFPLRETSFPKPPWFVQDPPEGLTLLVNLLLLLLFSGGIALLWRRFRPRSDAKAVVVTEAREALADLEAGSELKDVVLQCYAKMCAGLERSRRVKRRRAMTPREFEKSLARAGIASTHIQQLTRLFERVRYGARPSDQATDREARQCLQAILHVYGE